MLGYAVIWIYYIGFILPQTILIPWRIAVLAAAGIYLMTCALRRDIKIPIVAPVVIALLLQLWSFYTQVYASTRLGRVLGFARPETYILESMVPFFVTACLIQSDKHARETIPRMFLIPAGLSVLVGALQFCRIPFFLNFAQLYTYKSIDFWDGHPGLRAVGLTFHPSALAIQSAIAFVIIAVAARHRRLNAWEMVGVLFFSMGVVITQDRTMYAPFFIFWVVLAYWLIRKDIRCLYILISISIACLASIAIYAPRKFGYLTQGGIATPLQPPAEYPQHYFMMRPTYEPDPKWQKDSEWKDTAETAVQSQDISLNYRLQIWKAQMQPIWPDHAMTGIGPSSGLLNGTGPEDKWVPVGHVMECGFLLILAMYGLPGLFIFCGGLIVSVISPLFVAYDRAMPRARANAGFIASASVMMIIAGCATANTVDNYMKVPLAWMMGGLAVKCAYDGFPTRRGVVITD
jgi:hypothetical protein